MNRGPSPGPLPVRSQSATTCQGMRSPIDTTDLVVAAWGCQAFRRWRSSSPGPLAVPRLPLAFARGTGTLAIARYVQGARAPAPAPRLRRSASRSPSRFESASSHPFASSGEDGRMCSARLARGALFLSPNSHGSGNTNGQARISARVRYNASAEAACDSLFLELAIRRSDRRDVSAPDPAQLVWVTLMSRADAIPEWRLIGCSFERLFRVRSLVSGDAHSLEKFPSDLRVGRASGCSAGPVE